MGSDLPGVYYRADRGWSPHVRALVGSQMYGDETMARWAVGAIDDDQVQQVLLSLAGLVAVLLAQGRWGEGCANVGEVRTRWAEATAALVGELEMPPVPDGTWPTGDEDDGEADRDP